MSNEQLEALGKALRSDIEQEIKRLDNEAKFRMLVDVTPIARKYFKIGMPFSEAEAIMRGAGMQIAPIKVRPGEDLPSDSKYDIYGTIAFEGMKDRTQGYFFKQPNVVAFNVHLSANFLSPSDITIKDVSATIAFPIGL